MPHFIREKKIDCGAHYKEVDIFPQFESEETHKKRKGKRNKKEKESEPKQKNLNDKNSKRYFIQLANMNFGADPKAIHLTMTYNDENLPATLKDAEKEVSNFLRRVSYLRKKEGLKPLKYILVTEYGENEEAKDTRIHHHIIMNGGLDRDTAENLWRRKKKKGQEEGDKIGYANADRLQADEKSITALCVYLSKRPRKKKKWSSSHNLARPTSRANDTKYSKRQVEKWAKDNPPIEFWEKKYPGWSLTNIDYGATYEYNDVTASWSIYLKLRKKE